MVTDKLSAFRSRFHNYSLDRKAIPIETVQALVDSMAEKGFPPAVSLAGTGGTPRPVSLQYFLVGKFYRMSLAMKRAAFFIKSHGISGKTDTDRSSILRLFRSHHLFLFFFLFLLHYFFLFFFLNLIRAAGSHHQRQRHQATNQQPCNLLYHYIVSAKPRSTRREPARRVSIRQPSEKASFTPKQKPGPIRRAIPVEYHWDYWLALRQPPQRQAAEGQLFAV